MAKTETAPKTEKPTKVRKPRTPKPPVQIPSLDTFKGEAKTEFEAVLGGAKMLTEAYNSANNVSVGHLREVRRAVFQALNNSMKGRKKDPVTKKRERLQRQIEKAQKALAEMGVE